jgi:uncharacterized membrane protein
MVENTLARERKKERVNIGIGLILLSVALLFLISGMFLRKKRKKVCSNSLLIAGTLILSAGLLLITGVYDPYANHISI